MRVCGSNIEEHADLEVPCAWVAMALRSVWIWKWFRWLDCDRFSWFNLVQSRFDDVSTDLMLMRSDMMTRPVIGPV